MPVSRRVVDVRRTTQTHLRAFAFWLAFAVLAAGQGWRGLVVPAGGEAPGIETRVLGDGDSIGDMISGTYGRSSGVDLKVKSKRKPQSTAAAPAKLTTTSRSGLTKAPPPAPRSPLFAIFGFPQEPLPPEPMTVPAVRTAPAALPQVTYYRTVCVRLCDGAFFPINYSTTSDRFDRDEEVCQKSCSAPAKLYVTETRNGTLESMRDVEGRPYTKLTTAFQYRTAYDPSCTCKPHPWSEEAQSLHRKYALEAAQRKGDRRAEAELEIMKAAEAAQAAAGVRPNSKVAEVRAGVLNDATAGAITDDPGEPPELPVIPFDAVQDGALPPEAAEAVPEPAATKPKAVRATPPRRPAAQIPKPKRSASMASRSQTAADVFHQNFGR